jgi:hypothetical protein
MAFSTYIESNGAPCDKCGKPGTPSDRLLCMIESSGSGEYHHHYHEMIRLHFGCLNKIINQALEEKASA